MGREYAENAGRTGPPPDFTRHVSIETAVKELPVASVGILSEATYRHRTFVLSEVLGLRLWYW